jgi:hypothetical protein
MAGQAVRAAIFICREKAQKPQNSLSASNSSQLSTINHQPVANR